MWWRGDSGYENDKGGKVDYDSRGLVFVLLIMVMVTFYNCSLMFETISVSSQAF